MSSDESVFLKSAIYLMQKKPRSLSGGGASYMPREGGQGMRLWRRKTFCMASRERSTCSRVCVAISE